MSNFKPDNYESISEWLNTHRGKIIGIFVGLLLSISFILWGVLKTFLIIICVSLGYFCGKQLDNQVDIGEWLLRLLNRER